MSNLQAEMKFEIGEMVYLKVDLHDTHKLPQRYMILARIIEQTSGGLHLFYTVAREGGTGKVSEIELTREATPDNLPVTEEMPVGLPPASDDIPDGPSSIE